MCVPHILMSNVCSRDPNYAYLPTVFARFLISTARAAARNIGGFSERRLRSQLRRCFHRPNISPDTSPGLASDRPSGSTPASGSRTSSGKKRKRILKPLLESSEDEANESDNEPIVSTDSEEDREEPLTKPKGKGKGKHTK